MKKYKLWIKKYNLLKNENEIIEEVIATNDIYHEIGYIYIVHHLKKSKEQIIKK